MCETAYEPLTVTRMCVRWTEVW